MTHFKVAGRAEKRPYLTSRPRTGPGTSRYMVIVNHSSILFAKVFKIL